MLVDHAKQDYFLQDYFFTSSYQPTPLERQSTALLNRFKLLPFSPCINTLMRLIYAMTAVTTPPLH